ncbi:UNVERIFIED_CONTAM: hypothetical protein RKD43_006912 [Streptomyces graminofaciens]
MGNYMTLKPPKLGKNLIVDKSLCLGAEGAHRPAVAHTDPGLHPACQKRLMDSYGTCRTVPRSCPTTRGPEPALTADLIAGTLHTALAAVDGGAPFDTVTERTLVLVRRCLTPLRSMVQAPEDGH